MRPWFASAVVYTLDVQTFQDGDGDGRGDLQGLARRLDYLLGLGVNCLWLLPIHPTPDRDDGYDVTDHYAVDRRLGTFGDLVAVLREADARGIRVLLDLVVNHTSVDHRWFQAARHDRDAPTRRYYVWTDDPAGENAERGAAARPVFPGAEDSVWERDETAEYMVLSAPNTAPTAMMPPTM